MSDPLAAYDQQASELAELYEGLSFEGCHRDALDVVPGRPGRPRRPRRLGSRCQLVRPPRLGRRGRRARRGYATRRPEPGFSGADPQAGGPRSLTLRAQAPKSRAKRFQNFGGGAAGCRSERLARWVSLWPAPPDVAGAPSSATPGCFFRTSVELSSRIPRLSDPGTGGGSGRNGRSRAAVGAPAPTAPGCRSRAVGAITSRSGAARGLGCGLRGGSGRQCAPR